MSGNLGFLVFLALVETVGLLCLVHLWRRRDGGGAQMVLLEKDELAEALALDVTGKALGVSVQVETVRWQADR